MSQQDVERDFFKALRVRLLVTSALKDSTVLIKEWEQSLMTTDVQPATTVRQEHRVNERKNVRLVTTVQREPRVSNLALKALIIPIQLDRLQMTAIAVLRAHLVLALVIQV